MASDRRSILEAQLNSFDAAARAAALDELLALARSGEIALPPEQAVANMHCHTFFSFNAYGHSPSSLVWLAKTRGWRLIGSVDFDVLDAVDEFLGACERAHVRGSSGIETRVFIPEFATREINSPGEPGVCYHMGIGFTSGQVSPEAAAILADLRARAAARNRDIIARVNAYLDPITVDFDADILPLTPGANPTERHIVLAYTDRAAKLSDPVAFWSEKLATPREQMEKVIADKAALQNLVRGRLMKAGGVGYVQPGAGAFPSVETFHALIEACGALPCAAWLDGMSAGEQAIDELLNLLISKGVVGFNIIPDRNWNFADPDVKKKKVAALYQVVQIAQDLALPLNIGTEMNSFGQKLIDDFDTHELAPLRKAFLDGAQFIYGHTQMARRWGLGYQSAWAKAALPERAARNRFYTQVGKHLSPEKAGAFTFDAAMTPDAILAALEV
mgnify:CR=1 FL=1|jgi:hypothetical protein